MLITLKLEDELPVSQTQEVLVSTPSVFVFRGFLFVLLVICKLVEPFLCIFYRIPCAFLPSGLIFVTKAQ